MINCPWCKNTYEPSASGRCPHCGTVPPPGEKEVAPAPGPEPGSQADEEAPAGPANIFDFLLGPEGGGLPWERRSEFGPARALWLTLKIVLLSPLRAFRVMRRTGGWKEPLLYALAVGGAAWALSGILEALLAHARGGAYDVLSLFLRALSRGGESDASLRTRLVVALAKAPVLAVLLPALAALGGQLCLRLFGERRAALSLTFAVSCYATASAAVLTVVPFCGSFIFFGWYVVIATIGLLSVHRTRLLPAVVAALAPPLAAVLAGGAFFLAIERWRSSNTG